MRCSICKHPQVLSINQDLATDTAGKVSKRYNLSFSATFRHKKKLHHLASGTPEASNDRVLRIVQQVERLIADAEREGTLEARTAAIRAGTPALRLLSQISGDLKALAPAPKIDGKRLEDSPEFRLFISKIISILDEIPGARERVLSCIAS
jgi:hypothetical protein